jgi:hypothetical protein
MASLRSVMEIVGELHLLATGGLDGESAGQSGRGDLLPVVLDATASMPARAAGTVNLSPAQVLAALTTLGDSWYASSTLSGVYILNGRAAGRHGNPALAGAPAGAIAAIYAGPLPVNVASTPLFWVRIA